MSEEPSGSKPHIVQARHLWSQIARNARVISDVAHHPLHRRHRIRAVARWARTLAAIALAPSHEISVDYIDGSILHWPAAASSVGLCAKFGLGEYADMAFCLHLLRACDLFCDVGANAGVYTVLAAHAVGCRVVSVEPVPSTFQLLMQNIHANGLADRVDSRCNGIGSEPGRLAFTTERWSLNHVVDPETDNAAEIDVITLDTLLDGREPAVIKIDVEGFEAHVLAGGAHTLRSPVLQAVLIEMTDQVQRYGSSLAEIRTLLCTAGLHGPYWYAPEQRQLIQPGKPGPTQYNEIYVRNPETAANRLSTAATHEIHGTRV